LRAAVPGDVLWTERDQRSVSGDAKRIRGTPVITAQWYALHPQTLQVIPITRIEIPQEAT
jgi:hypothetical protein